MRKLARMLDVWIASPLPGRQGSVADAIQGEEAAWTALCRDISHIRTNTRFSPRSNLQLFGLPCAGALGRMLKKKADEAEQRERARHEREQLETEARLAQFRARAMRDIGDLAATWLNRTPSAGRQDTARDGIESDRFRRCDRRAQSKSSRTRPRTRDVAAQAESRRGAGRLALALLRSCAGGVVDAQFAPRTRRKIALGLHLRRCNARPVRELPAKETITTLSSRHFLFMACVRSRLRSP
ncbi:hypothetical protein ABIF66_001328 [Bradyrhizobium japonicum]